MNLIDHAKLEMDIAGIYSPDGDDIDDWVRDAVLDLLETLSKHGPSGATVGYIVSIFSKLALYEPLTSITGDDKEWTNVWGSDDQNDLFQNKRCSHIFKQGKDGQAYDINGRIFVDQNGVAFTQPGFDPENPQMSSTVYITFPYTPKSEYVKVFYDYDNENVDFVILEDQSNE